MSSFKMDYFKEDLDIDSTPRWSSRYMRDHDRDHERDLYDERRGKERYDYDRDLDYRGSYPSISDDPIYRMMSRPLLPHPRDSIREILPPKEPLSEGIIPLGSVVLIPMNPLEPKPKRREKPACCKTVFVGSLPESCSDKNLYDLFSNCGNIIEVRVSRGRNFGHVQFSLESSVERAMELSGCFIRIENSTLPKDSARIHVDYAQDKAEVELKKRIQENEMISFTTQNAVSVSTDLHREDIFCYAAKNVINWLKKGSCDGETANTFFGLMTSINSHGRKIAKNIKAKEDAEDVFHQKKKEYFNKMANECDMMLDVFETATNGRPWNYFTKAQRKSITQWKDYATDIRGRLKEKLEKDENDDNASNEPPTKMMKMEDQGVQLQADLERAQREIEQLKTDREVAVEKKDKQILQLKTLLAKFKKTCPEEWDRAIGVKVNRESDEMDVGNGSDIIEGVSLDDLNTVISKDGSENSLASAAAAYAQLRNKVGSDEMSGLGLSEAEVAIVSVLAAFLTVHPLGATIESITDYFQTFNPAYNSYYLESLLRRLTKVFQLSGEGGGKWWFLGFQTCYATPNTTNDADSKKTS